VCVVSLYSLSSLELLCHLEYLYGGEIHNSPHERERERERDLTQKEQNEMDNNNNIILNSTSEEEGMSSGYYFPEDITC